MDSFREITTAVLSVLPAVEIARSILTDRRVARLEGLLEQLKREESDSLVEFLKSENGFHLLEVVADRVWREHSERKRKRFANLIISAWIDTRPPEIAFDEAALFVNAIDEFTESHIAILTKLFNERESGTVFYRDLGNYGQEEKLIVMDSLCGRFAMVERAWDLGRPEVTGGIMFSRNLSPEGIARKCFHKITPLGCRFVSYTLRES